ncbi:hypothetical protein [Argonema antarcticum]|uniref:hypothetical protein n=1 Tax=Argonema antarcticum TaxID=2942763 RepID=UPI002012226E|nr:hypothetical protein [Argonema antarcticum]MCL1470675.1 hypothetical protein [Argonema antarcticum A004/B2]
MQQKPPQAELIQLYQAAKIGDFDQIEAEADRIEQLGTEYIYFGDRIRELAQDFNDRAILDLVKKDTII